MKTPQEIVEAIRARRVARSLERRDATSAAPAERRPRGRSIDDASRAGRAVATIERTGCTIREAAAEHRISHQAVHQAWKARYPDRAFPTTIKHAERMDRIRALAALAMPPSQIATELGVERDIVAAQMHHHGIAAVPEPWGIAHREPERLAAAIDIVRHGGTVAEGAAAAGVGYATFRKHVRAAGVKPSRKGGRLRSARSRSEEAFRIWRDEGVPVDTAALRAGVAGQSFRKWLVRHGHWPAPE